MSEYRTKPVNRPLLLAELAAVCEALSSKDIGSASVSFGLDSNLSIEQMWKAQMVAVKDICSFVANSESTGIVKVGSADIFVETPGFLFTLCHEGDVHVKGDSSLVTHFVHRWDALRYDPYEIQNRV